MPTPNKRRRSSAPAGFLPALHALIAGFPEGTDLCFVNGELQGDAITLPSRTVLPDPHVIVASLSPAAAWELAYTINVRTKRVNRHPQGSDAGHTIETLLSKLSEAASEHGLKRFSFRKVSKLYIDDLRSLFELLGHPIEAIQKPGKAHVGIPSLGLTVDLSDDGGEQVSWFAYGPDPCATLAAQSSAGAFRFGLGGDGHVANLLAIAPYVQELPPAPALIGYWAATFRTLLEGVNTVGASPETRLFATVGSPDKTTSVLRWINALGEPLAIEASAPQLPDVPTVRRRLLDHFSRLPASFSAWHSLMPLLGDAVLREYDQKGETIKIETAYERALVIQRSPSAHLFRVELDVQGFGMGAFKRVLAEAADVGTLRALLAEPRFNWRAPGNTAERVSVLTDAEHWDAPELACVRGRDFRLKPWVIFDAEVTKLSKDIQPLVRRWELEAAGLEV
jgi:hypothetical protein